MNMWHLTFYGFTIPDKRKSETHLRSIERMLDRLLAIDDQPLSVARPVDKRLIGNLSSLCAVARRHLARKGHSCPVSLRVWLLFQSALL